MGYGSITLSPKEYRAAAQERLDELVEEVENTGGVAEAHLRIDTQGSMEDEHIVGLAEELGADLIVAGSRGLSGMQRLLNPWQGQRTELLAQKGKR